MRNLGLRQFGGLVLAGVLALVSSVATITETQALLAPESTPVVPVRPADGPVSPDSDEEPDSSADLGIQPILLLDRVAKPAGPLHPAACLSAVADALDSCVPQNTIPFRLAMLADRVAVLTPAVLVGRLHQPHGPPTYHS